MSSFIDALDFVHGALSDLHRRGVKVNASLSSLNSLAELTRESVESRPVAAPEERPAVAASHPAAIASSAAPAVRTVAPPAPVPARARPAPVRFTPTTSSAPAVLSASAPLAADAAAPGSKAERLAALHAPLRGCTLCPHLVKSRTQVVVGVGNPEAELMFVGEAPGEDEDRLGEPFVGRAGQLLTKIIEAMGFRRDTIYIANVLKCRPDMPPGASGNRKPQPTEMQTCLPYLEQQIAIIQPRVLVALGNTAMQGLTGTTDPMARLRGRWHDFRGVPLMATYHPAYLLRDQSPGEKRKVWEDMMLVLTRLGLEISEKQRGYFLRKE